MHGLCDKNDTMSVLTINFATCAQGASVKRQGREVLGLLGFGEFDDSLPSPSSREGLRCRLNLFNSPDLLAISQSSNIEQDTKRLSRDYGCSVEGIATQVQWRTRVP